MKYFIVSLLGLVLVSISPMSTLAQWTAQTSPLGTTRLGTVQFVSATEGWIVALTGGKLPHTLDAGANWTIVTPFPSDAVWVPAGVGRAVSLPDASKCWVIGS